MAKPRDVTVRMPTVDEVLPPEFRTDILRRIGLLAIGRIRSRTKRGVDIQGRAFKPYAKGYADLRRRAGFQTTPDLWIHGGMLGSMAVVEATPQRALVAFEGSSPRTRFVTRARARRGKAYSVREKVGGIWVTRKKGAVISDLTAEPQSRTISNALKAFYNQKARPFFGLSREDRAFLLRQALKDILAVVGKLSLTRAVRR